MRKTFIDTSEFTEWVRDYGAESRGGDHYGSSPIPRHSLERLGWGSKSGEGKNRRLLGEPHYFRAARIRVSGGRPKCGARRHSGRLPPADSIDRWRISKNLNRICTGRLYRTFDQAATVSFPILGYVIRTLLSFPTDRAGILLAQLAVEPDA